MGGNLSRHLKCELGYQLWLIQDYLIHHALFFLYSNLTSPSYRTLCDPYMTGKYSHVFPQWCALLLAAALHVSSRPLPRDDVGKNHSVFLTLLCWIRTSCSESRASLCLDVAARTIMPWWGCSNSWLPVSANKRSGRGWGVKVCLKITTFLHLFTCSSLNPVTESPGPF